MMQPAEIRKAIGAARAVCGAYHERPEGAQECLRLDLAASNIAALFEMSDDNPSQIRPLVLQAAVLARIVATGLRLAGRKADQAIPVGRAVAGWEAALLELEREIEHLPGNSG
jgi:hypothetical protein